MTCACVCVCVCVFLYAGSVFIDLYRPTFLQKLCNALPTPQPTWMLSQLLDQAVTDSFSKQHPPSKQLLKDVQQALFNRGGAQIHHKLVRSVCVRCVCMCMCV